MLFLCEVHRDGLQFIFHAFGLGFSVGEMFFLFSNPDATEGLAGQVMY